MAIKSGANESNEERCSFFVIEDQGWYKRFNSLLNQETGRTADLALRKFQIKAADNFGVDPAAFRYALICLLEQVVFSPLKSDLPYEFLAEARALYEGHIKAAEKCKRDLGEPIHIPRGQADLFPMEVKLQKVRKALDELLRVERDQRRCVVKLLAKYDRRGNLIKSDKKDEYTII